MITTSDKVEDYMEYLKNNDPLKEKRIDKDDQWYFSDTTYVSNSMLKVFQEGGIRNYECYLNGELKKSSKAFSIGSAFHCMVLEPGEFDKRYYVFDDKAKCEEIGGARPRTTKKYSQWYDTEVLPKINGREVITLEDMEKLDLMYASLMKIDEAEQLIKSLDLTEATYTGTLRDTPVKCKVDGVKFEDTIMDLKTTGESVKQFYKSSAKFKYDQAAAFYTDIMGIRRYVFLVVETNYPYNVGIFEVSDEYLERGREKYEKGLDDLNFYTSNPKLDVETQYIKETLY